MIEGLLQVDDVEAGVGDDPLPVDVGVGAVECVVGQMLHTRSCE